MTAAIKGQQFFINGRVQGVFYRRFACKEALALGLTGWTRNLEDGRVEVKAFGSEEALLMYKEKLSRGPIAANVTAVEIKDIDVEVFAGFEVI